MFVSVAVLRGVREGVTLDVSVYVGVDVGVGIKQEGIESLAPFGFCVRPYSS